MYLIKCAKCNTLVEVKTEFLMLCPNCKSKLENNYQEWRKLKENKGKNFQVYLKEVCISSEELEEQQRHERLEKLYSPEKNKVRKIANLVCGVLLITAAAILAIRLQRLLGESWMRSALLSINIGVSVVGAGLMALYALKRKKFQDFVPMLIGLAVFALIVTADMAFFIITDNM
ncbi:MAG: hypothetical protein MJZ02_00850 [Paludibacteraceae bacterium]|nr:hypothetical protein [Paludibacteraceae bacterium]